MLIYKKWLTLFTLLLALLPTAATTSPLPNQEFDPQRAKLLGFIVSQHLTRHHYSHKVLNDDLSVAAFDLYLKQLDAQKRFLLKTDVKMLGAYESYIDNEIRRGMIHLPIYSEEIMSERIPVVSTMVSELLAAPFDYTRAEQLETDNKKLDFCENDQQLRERWRKILKYQVANRYLDLKQDAEQEAAEDRTKRCGNRPNRRNPAPASPGKSRQTLQPAVQSHAQGAETRTLQSLP